MIDNEEQSYYVMNLIDGSLYEGTINEDNSVKNIGVKLSKNARLVLTGDSYIAFLDNEDPTNSNVELNEHKLYIATGK